MNALVAARMIICLSLVVSLVSCGGSSSTPASTPVEVLDQDSGVTAGGISPVFDNADRAQTFTVGESGLLSKIDLMVWEPLPAGADLIIDVRQTTGGVPNESDAINDVLLTFSVSAGVLLTMKGEHMTFEVSQHGVQVTAGQVLAIVLRSPGGASTGYSWGTDTQDPYLPGARHSRLHNGANVWVDSGGHDSGFRTYVTR